ncbi:hypothetical protein F4553_003614 [Allocatelliglobosispora scoriae]|uniref:GerMN domain-containing protein n=1 Tax=Allocatelliglobosispora scoriae TaxID=643052 RepID=A0A841BRA5_9ACTN|nr:LpqB family beta-propeller domain-containing protein [Allocatelliglobosispora scoriae]MBB5870235.1 hypothetical protein [Allocatelliglobosispora scoriae]
MNRRQLMRMAVLAGMSGGLAACGIDNDGGVVIDGPGPSGGSGVGGGLPVVPKLRRDAVSAAQLIQYFLAAPAGIEDEKAMLARVRAFLAPAAKDWSPRNNSINVVRAVAGELKPDSSSNKWSQQITILPIGVLLPGGMLAPPTRPGSRKITLRVSAAVDESVGGFYIITDEAGDEEPLDEILLSEAALGQFYQPRSLYYWNTENTALVPDLRYISRAYDDARRRDAMVKLLVEDGPAPWVAPAVLRFPQNSTKIGNVVQKEGNLIVNLSSGTTAIRDTNKVGSQLRWTLHRELASGALDVALQIESEPRATVRDYLSDNRAWRSPNAPDRGLFAIVESQLVSLDSHQVSSLMSVLTPKESKETDPKLLIESAAITADGQTVAAVRRDAEGQRYLVIGSESDPKADPLQYSLTAGASVSRPVWLGGESVLLVVGGELMQFSRAGGKQGAGESVSGQPNGKRITSVAVAPDGRRLALLVNGRVYMVAIQGMKKPIELASEGRYLPLELPLESPSHVTAVAFGAEDRLILGWTGDLGRPYIGECNVFGGDFRMILEEVGPSGIRVLSLSASPISPTDPLSLVAVYSTVKGSFRITPNEQLSFKGQLPQVAPSGSPSASTSATPKAPIVSSPFFTS